MGQQPPVNTAKGLTFNVHLRHAGHWRHEEADLDSFYKDVDGAWGPDSEEAAATVGCCVLESRAPGPIQPLASTVRCQCHLPS